jgi:MFS family permease
VIYDLDIPINTGLDEAAWIVTGYLLAYSIAMTFMGRLSDLYGRRRIFLISLAIFALGSYLVATAETWPANLVTRFYSMLVSKGRPDTSHIALATIIASRMIQAFGAGAMVPVGMAMVGDLYTPGRRARMLAIIVAVDTAGWVIGHLYGGILVRYLDWRMIFWLNLPICAIAFLLIFILMSTSEKAQARAKMDWAGALLISVALSLFNIGFGAGTETTSSGSAGQETSIPSYILPTLLAALIFLGLFIYRERHAKSPLIKLDIFRRDNFSVASIANFLLGFSLFIAIANVPLFINTLIAQNLEQGAWDSGWLLSALTVPMAIAAFPGGWLTDRLNYRWPSAIGLMMSILGFFLMSQWTTDTPYASMIPHLALTGVGFGLTMAPIAAAALDTSPQDYRGTASGLVILFRLIGMTLGVSSITTYGLYRTNTLSASLITTDLELSEMTDLLTTITETVISEALLIAGGFCVLALATVLKLRTLQSKK